MYLSKIWLFLISLVAAAAVALALLMPRPAERAHTAAEKQKLATACGFINILLTDQARQQLALTSVFATQPDLVTALQTASNQETLDDTANQNAAKVGKNLVESIKNQPPAFAMLLDKRGRVVARIKLDEKEFGDTAAGRPLIDNALSGYTGDDVWVGRSALYMVRAAPVVRRDPPIDYVGAVVLGYSVNNELSKQLATALASPGVDVGFFVSKETIAMSKPSTFDNQVFADAVAKLGADRSVDCAQPAITLKTSSGEVTAAVARLPGEAQDKSGYYAVLIERPQGLGFMGTIKSLDKKDLAPGSFPWGLIAGAFSVLLAAGVGFIVLEHDRPLKKLAVDAVKLGKGEADRLTEGAHGGKFGSIARSVNIHVDKINRDAKAAKQDLDGLLGPATGGAGGTIDLLAAALPAKAAPAAPPPSAFKFSDGGKAAATGSGLPGVGNLAAASAPALPAMGGGSGPTMPRPATPKPVAPAAPAAPPVRTSAPAASASTPIKVIDDEVLSDDALIEEASGPTTSSGTGTSAGGNAYFQQIFDEFIATKKQCGEPTTGVTFDKFAAKLERNRTELISKTGCKEVKFTVYTKDGKAALKASPVRDEA